MKTKRNLLGLIKLLVSLVLLVYIFKKIDLEHFLTALSHTNTLWFFIAFAIGIGANFLACWRWYFLTRSNQKKISWSYLSAVKIYFVSIFYNNIFPSSVGGDLVRVLRLRGISKDTGGSLNSVLVDRLVGFVAAISLAVVLMLAYFRQSGQFFPEMIILLVLFIAVIFFLFEQRILSLFLGPIFRLLKKDDWLPKFFVSFRLYTKNKKVLLISFLVAVGYQALCNVIVFILAKSLGLSIPPLAFFVIMPIVTIVTLLPVSINGLGVQDAAMIALFVPLGPSTESILTLSILLHIQRFMYSLVGGIILLAENITGLGKTRIS